MLIYSTILISEKQWEVVRSSGKCKEIFSYRQGNIFGILISEKWWEVVRNSEKSKELFSSKLEDRGAQAPLILAPAEGFRGPSAPFGGLRPLLWGLWPLLEAYGLSQYHQWISQLEYMLFDTQHVEIGPKMAEIVQIAWKLREIAWTRAWNFLKVLPMNFSARVHAFWYPTCWNWPKNGWNS